MAKRHPIACIALEGMPIPQMIPLVFTLRQNSSFIGKLRLLPGSLPLAGGQSVIHTGPPIVVTLANKVVSFNCKITYLYISKYKNFKVNYFYVNRQSQTSTEEHTDCTPSQGTENQTHSVECQVTSRLQDASATGMYYCSVHWQEDTKIGNGTFILVRDSGYQKPAQPYLKSLLLGFTGFLTVLSVLGTALLLWKKKRMLVPGKQLASSSKQPPSEPIYTRPPELIPRLPHHPLSDALDPPTPACLLPGKLPPWQPARIHMMYTRKEVPASCSGWQWALLWQPPDMGPRAQQDLGCA
ncbi:PREDICTED: NFAT activation molecule 1 [Chrysochloris asiatica]|uniref:NFAT activation molecule 1 n=1 Tax=Chrysochloris asiatica TaxID=185453 RepID=A0A9B0WS91_CHRAS|nr:PREDICTED: NFAT activation molecule 1 [Chrysochloris asiatica]